MSENAKPESAATAGAAAPAAAPVDPDIRHGAARFDADTEAEAPAVKPRQRSAPAPYSKPDKHRRERESWLVTFQSLLGTIVIALYVITFATQAFQIPSESMENTLLIGDYLLVDKVQFAPEGRWAGLEPHAEIQRGDVVVFHYPVDPSQHFVKRVVGVPGDHVRLINKHVWVNGKVLNDRAYAIYKPGSDPFRDNFPSGAEPPLMGTKWMAEISEHVRNGELIVPGDSYFVLGDNRDNSDDSRYWGFVPRANIVGRPLLIYFSLSPAPLAYRPQSEDGKLTVFGMALTQFWQDIRWHRTLRLVY
ncbi:MAG TPA: signal peptidase I [Terriglobales bacterium]|nr:signal peptidase I [Terriglobales bacterium]